MINEIEPQYLFLDRRSVYQELIKNNIPVPSHVVVTRDENNHITCSFSETENSIIVDGIELKKPFVEKPVRADDHNIWIYYPRNAGGGCKKLFRKIGNESSKFDPSVNEVRKDGSYIYEQFLATDGTDIKVYTVGPNYAHAEARKSPVYIYILYIIFFIYIYYILLYLFIDIRWKGTKG